MGLGFKIIIATSKTDLSVQYAFRYASSEALKQVGFIHKVLGMRCYVKLKSPIRGHLELCLVCLSEPGVMYLSSNEAS